MQWHCGEIRTSIHHRRPQVLVLGRCRAIAIRESCGRFRLEQTYLGVLDRNRGFVGLQSRATRAGGDSGY